MTVFVAALYRSIYDQEPGDAGSAVMIAADRMMTSGNRPRMTGVD